MIHRELHPIHKAARIAAALALFLLVDAPDAAAADAVVTLVRPRAPGALTREATQRLAAELGAAGFVVRIIEASGGDAREEVERVEGSIATIALVPSARGAVADVWIADRVTGKTVVRRVDVRDPTRANAASDLAVRSVELLRASLLEIKQRRTPAGDLPEPVTRLADAAPSPAAPPSPLAPSPAAPPSSAAPPPPRDPPPPAPSAPLVSTAPPRPAPAAITAPSAASTGPRVRIEAAVAMLASPEGGPSFGPLLRLAVDLPVPLTVRLTVAPAAAPITLTAPQGTVAARQTLAGIDLAHVFFTPGARLRPSVAVGGGVYGLDVDGDAATGFISQRATAVSGFLSASAGLSLRITEGLGAAADLTALVLIPGQAVIAVGEPLAHLGRPAFLPSIGLVADLD